MASVFASAFAVYLGKLRASITKSDKMSYIDDILSDFVISYCRRYLLSWKPTYTAKMPAKTLALM